MEENERVFDMINRLSVMVDNDRGGRLFIESREIDKAALMGIDNDEQGLSSHEREGFVDIDYLAVPAVSSEHIDSGAGKVAGFSSRAIYASMPRARVIDDTPTAAPKASISGNE